MGLLKALIKLFGPNGQLMFLGVPIQKHNGVVCAVWFWCALIVTFIKSACI